MSSQNGEADLTLADLLGRLTVKQFWGVAVALVALIGGSIGIGAWVQSARDEDKVADKNRVISDLGGKINTINGQLEEARRNFDGATDAIKSAARERQALEGKASFLERFLSYKVAPSGQSGKLFIDHVCALWKNSEDRSVHWSYGGLNVTEDQIRGGLSPELRRLLIEKGVPEEFFQKAQNVAPIRTSPSAHVARTPPTASDAIAVIHKQVQLITLVRQSNSMMEQFIRFPKK
jgi:hypothetical protein